jgi:hypothetical protein
VHAGAFADRAFVEESGESDRAPSRGQSQMGGRSTRGPMVFAAMRFAVQLCLASQGCPVGVKNSLARQAASLDQVLVWPHQRVPPVLVVVTLVVQESRPAVAPDGHGSDAEQQQKHGPDEG